VTEAGLYLPTKSDEKKKSEGKVLAAGPDCENIQIGDVVLFMEYSAEDVDEGLVLVPQEAVLSRIVTNEELT